MHQSLIIIDNFLSDPEYFRDVAGKMDFPDLREISNFPGRNSLQRLNAPDIDATISDVVGEALLPLTHLSHAKFRLTLKDDTGKAKVHLDNSQWSGILYLSEDEQGESGTDFFKHKETNLDSALLSPNDITRLGWENQERAQVEINKIIQNETNNDNKWEHIMRVPMKYNRLLLLRPWLWHTAGPGFGDSLDDGRLVYLLFYGTSTKLT